MTPFLGGLLLGLASSAHCVAMCGPLVLAIGGRLAPPSRSAQLTHALLHHSGRTLTYVLLALPAGLAGETLAWRGFGRGVAIAAGLVLLAAAASSARLPLFDRVTARISAAVAPAFAPVLRWAAGRRVTGALVTGALNGLLPCGLVYAALATAAAAGSVPGALLLMAGFGAGTAAVLVAMAVGMASVPAALRARLRPLGPLVLTAAALILIVRGVALPHQHVPAPAAPATQHSHH